MALPRCGISFCFFAPNPALFGVSHSVQIICWIISWMQSQDKISQGGQARDGGGVAPGSPSQERTSSSKPAGTKVMSPCQACGARDVWAPRAPAAVPGHLGCAGIPNPVVLTCPGAAGAKRTKHNSSGQEPSVNLRSSNSHSQPVTFRKPFQVLLHSESLFLAVFLA